MPKRADDLTDTERADAVRSGTMSAPRVALTSLDTLWFQVAGTRCNLACTHCFVSCSPTNRTHEMLSLAEIRRHLDDAERLGVKEFYFTGGEPFLNPEMEAILAETLRRGPATVLTNGLLLDAERCARLARLADGARYSLDLRVSLDGYDAAANDPIRGEGTFDRVVAALRRLHAVGLAPVVTVTEVDEAVASEAGRRRFLELLAELGIARPRLKVLPLFHIGAEAERSRAYASWERLTDEDAAEGGLDHLQCSSCRTVTDQGVWVCPILVNEPEARLGARLPDALRPFELAHPACFTCHVHGVSCRT